MTIGGVALSSPPETGRRVS